MQPAGLLITSHILRLPLPSAASPGLWLIGSVQAGCSDQLSHSQPVDAETSQASLHRQLHFLEFSCRWLEVSASRSCHRDAQRAVTVVISRCPFVSCLLVQQNCCRPTLRHDYNDVVATESGRIHSTSGNYNKCTAFRLL